MKIKALSIYSKILSFFLVLLGFSACDSDNGGDGPVCEYGSPTAKFIVKGKVVNKEDQKSIEGLKVAIGEVYIYDNGKNKITFYHDSIQTNTNGEFDISIVHNPQPQKFVIKYEDAKNQGTEFGLTTDTVRFEKPDFTNGSSWYKGETTQDLGTVEISPVKEEK